MATYLILTPAAGPGKDHRDTRFVRDGFSLTAFFFPGFWLLWQQLWIHGAAAFLLQAIGVALVPKATLVLVFADERAHDAYQVHPVHDRFRAECSPCWESVRIFDSVGTDAA